MEKLNTMTETPVNPPPKSINNAANNMFPICIPADPYINDTSRYIAKEPGFNLDAGLRHRPGNGKSWSGFAVHHKTGDIRETSINDTLGEYPL